MIDTRTFEKYQLELEQAVDNYIKAKNEIAQIKEATIERIKEVGTGNPETQQVLNKMLKEVGECEITMQFAKAEFDAAKDKMIDMIMKIKMPRSY